MTKRWKQRPTGSTWGDWGDDDELGRINLVTSEKVLAGVREVENGQVLQPWRAEPFKFSTDPSPPLRTKSSC